MTHVSDLTEEGINPMPLRRSTRIAMFLTTRLRSFIRIMKFRARRHGLVFVVAIFGLALVGAACAVGYRNMFVGSVSPTLPPAIKAISTIASVSEPQAESSGNARQIGPATTGTIGTLASREEQPATIGRPKAAPGASLPRASVPATPAAGQAVPNQALPRAAVADPPAAPASIAAAPQRAGRSDGGDVTAASEPRTFGCGPCRTSQC